MALAFAGAGEYVWLFDAPIRGTIDASNSLFRININTGGVSTGATILEGYVERNTIGNPALANSGSFEGSGIFLGASGDGTHTTRVAGNTVDSIRSDGALSLNTSEGGGVLNVTLDTSPVRSSPSGARKCPPGACVTTQGFSRLVRNIYNT